MCLSKIIAAFCKSKQSEENGMKLRELKEKDFKQRVEEMLEMKVNVDGQTYLKAKDLLGYIGVDFEQLRHDPILWEELKSSLVKYVLVTNKSTPSSNIIIEPSYTRAQEKDNGKSIHYAFNENIICFMKKYYTNPNDTLPIKVIETVYHKLNSHNIS